MSEHEDALRRLRRLEERVVLNDDDEAEPLDQELVRRCVAGEESTEVAQYVAWLASNYRSWRDAWEEAVADDLGEHRGHQATLLIEPRSGRRLWYSAAIFAVAASLLMAVFLFPRGPGGLRDGGLVVAMRDGKVSGLDNYPEELREQAAAALANEAPQPASIAQLSENIPVVRDPNREPSSAIRYPYGTAVRNDRPEFAWQPLDGAESYRIEVFPADDDATAVTAELTEPRWTPDEPFVRGQVYRWRILYLTGGDEFVAPRADERPAVFSVIKQPQLSEVEQAEASVGDSDLLLGVVAYEAGLLDEAETHWRRLLENNPDNPLASSLLENIERARKPKAP